jgi:hypothetical protein
MAKHEKPEKPTTVDATATVRLKTFDTRLLDRLEAASSCYRVWVNDNNGYPTEYADEQRANFRRRLINAAQELVAVIGD